MANTFITPSQIASTAIALVEDDMVLAATVSRNFEADFNGAVGTTVNVRVPSVAVARSRALDSTDPIVVDQLVETTVPVSITDRLYHAVRLSDEDLTFRIERFAEQVTQPQARAIAVAVEAKVVAEMVSGATTDEALGDAYSAATPSVTLVALRKALRDQGVPLGRLYAAVGTEIYADIMNAAETKDVSQSGSASALNEATLAQRLRGFTVVESNVLDPKDIIVYPSSAFTLVLRAPAVPAGVAFGQSLSESGFALTWLRDYDATTLADRSIISTFVGTATLPAVRTNTGTDAAPVWSYTTAAIRVHKGGEVV